MVPEAEAATSAPSSRRAGRNRRTARVGPLTSTGTARHHRHDNLDELLRAADFVSLHVPLTADTRHLIDARALATIKHGAILVNTSRGAVVDEAALVDALRAGRLAAAGLDVCVDEPTVSAELRALPNTVLLPHVGSAIASARDAMARLCAENVIAAVEGREPPAAVV